MSTLRVFVSSPGDVIEERIVAERVLGQLRAEFAGRVDIQPLFWEYEPIGADGTYQAGIPPTSDMDLVVAILWGRLGTPLPDEYRKPNGERWQSGTEYEVETALASREETGKPHVLVYRKTAPLPPLPADSGQADEQVRQAARLKTYFDERFKCEPETGAFLAAVHWFDSSARFEVLLEEHARRWILRALPHLLPPDQDTLTPTLWREGRSPFRGLEVFEPEHAPIYFGRTEAIGAVLARLRKQRASGCPFVLILGMSGSGKSSLARAGVLPLLTRPRVIEDVAAWRQALMRPGQAGSDPFASLAGALSETNACGAELGPLDRVAAMLREDPAGVADAVVRRLDAIGTRDGPTHLVLVVDQLEELFLMDDVHDDDRQRFVLALDALVSTGRVWSIATMRDDYQRASDAIPALLPLTTGDGQYALALPTAPEIAQLIRYPASAAGLRFEISEETDERLDDVLRDATIRSPESLPLLEFALDELYRGRDGWQLTFAAYRAMGGVEGAIATRADEVWDGLSAAARDSFEDVFRLLTDVGSAADGALARRWCPLDLVQRTAGRAELVERFTEARLLIRTSDDLGRPVVGVAHETLFRSWGRLRRWIRKETPQLHGFARLRDASQRWNRGDEALPRGRRAVEQIQRLLSWFGDDADPLVRKFVDEAASVERRARRVRFSVAGLLLALVVAAIVLVVKIGLAEQDKKQADRKRQYEQAMASIAHGNRLMGAGDPVAARSRFRGAREVLAKAGFDTSGAQLALAESMVQAPLPLRTLRGGPRLPVAGVSVASDGQRVLALFSDETLVLWDSVTGEVVEQVAGGGHADRSRPESKLPPSRLACLAIDESGKRCFVAHERGVVTAHDLATLEPQATWQVPGLDGKDWISALVTDGKRLAVGTTGGRVWLVGLAESDSDGFVEIGSPAHPRDDKQRYPVSDLAFSPDGSSLASSGFDRVVRVWTLSTRLEAKAFELDEEPMGLAWRGDPDELWAGCYDRRVHRFVRQGDTWFEVEALDAHGGEISALASTRHANRRMTGSRDGRAVMWSWSTGGKRWRPVRWLDAGGVATAVSVGAAGNLAATGSSNGIVRLWGVDDAASADRVLREEQAYTTFSIAFSDDRRLLAVGSEDVRIFDLATGLVLARLDLGHGGTEKGVRDLLFVDGGRRLVLAVDAMDELLEWDLMTDKVTRVPALRPVEKKRLSAVALSEDEQTLVSGGSDGDSVVWQRGPDGSWRETRRLTGHLDVVRAVDISADGEWIVSGSTKTDGRLKFWRTSDDTPVRDFEAHAYDINAIQFVRGHDRVLTASGDGTLLLFDPLASAKPVRTFSGHSSSVLSLAVAPDRAWFVSGGRDRRVIVWNLRDTTIRHLRIPHSEPVFAVAVGPEGRFIASGSRDKDVHVWDTDFADASESHLERLARADDRGLPDALSAAADWFAFRGRWALAREALRRLGAARDLTDHETFVATLASWSAGDPDRARALLGTIVGPPSGSEAEGFDVYRNLLLRALESPKRGR